MNKTTTALALSFVIAFSGIALSLGSEAAAKKGADVVLHQIGTYQSGNFNQGSAEIVAYDKQTQRLFSINALAASVDILDMSNPANLTKISTVDLSTYGSGVNSVAVHNGLVVAAVQNSTKQAPGSAVFFDTDGNILKAVTVGALPDMVMFTPSGDHVLVANEGEPLDYCAPGLANDPEGSVSIIDVKDVKHLSQDDVRTAGFEQFNNAALDPSIRIFGPNATVAQDMEPEYITASDDKTAWITLQENNAIAKLDIKNGVITELVGLGFKDHGIAGNGIDASDKDGAIKIASWPVKGMYQPDGIDSYKAKGRTYLVTANEGDSRSYGCYSEEARVKNLSLDPTAFPDATTLKKDPNLGRLTVTTANGDANHDGKYEGLYAFGARSFSIWDEDGKQVFDSGDSLEQMTAAALPAYFNADNAENGAATFDTRSDNKGPEPEGIVLGEIKGSTFAFVSMERIGGVAVYDVTDPAAPRFVQYINNRDFTAPIDSPQAGDLGPEGMVFIPKSDSPTKNTLLVVGNEVSGSATIYEIQD
jgi:hypothetical protein